MAPPIQNIRDILFETTRWVRIWLYVIGFGSLIIGFFGNGYFDFLLYGSGLIFLSIIVYGVRYVLQPESNRQDDYAASIHRAGIEQFFNQNVPNARLQNSLAEIVQRTTFSRPSSIQPISEFYKSLTVVVILTTFAVTAQVIVGPIVLYFVSGVFACIYLSDSWFALRSRLYFRNRSVKEIDDYNTSHLEHMVGVFADQLGVETPEILYTESDSMLAGETNGFFSKPQLYISTQLLERQNHIQTGILAHELAHIYLDEETTRSYRYFQFLIPLSFIGFAQFSVSILSVGVLFGVLVISTVVITRQRHIEEFDADAIAAKLTQPEFVILAILEFSNYNPFLEEMASVTQYITRISNTHPRVRDRISRLSGQD